MRESETYLAILDKGREMELRYLIRDFARLTLGEPDEPRLTRLEGVTDIAKLRRMLHRTAQAANWQDLLDTP